MKRKARWTKHGKSRWSGRKHHSVHLDATTGPRVDAFCSARGLTKSTWAGQQLEDAMDRAEQAEQRASAPKQPWERPPFWARKGDE